MKLYYIANARIPTEKAHGIQIMKMCEAFASRGVEVTLLVPRRFNHIKSDPFEYYSVKNNFKIRYIFTIDTVKLGKLGFFIESFLFSAFSVSYCLVKDPDNIYSRDELPLYFLSFLGKRFYWESHTFKNSFVSRRVLKYSTKIITITKNLKEKYNNQNILVSPDAVDLDFFDIRLSKEEAKKELGLPLNKKIVLYTGHLYPWKGAHVLIDASRYLSKDIIVVFVGGTIEDIADFKNKTDKLQNIIIIGHKLYKDIPKYLKAADVLVLPNSGEEDISRKYTSPMKLFEYMASGRPIIASDLKSIREVLNESNSYLIESDNPTLLASTIENVLSRDTAKITMQAYGDVRRYTWTKRAESILTFITH